MNNDLKNSIDFLNKKTNQKNGFVVPENYFEELDDNIINKKAANLPIKSPFKVPDSYFNTLDDAIFDKVKSEKTQKKKVIPLYQKLVKLIPTVAAASVLIFLGYYLFIQNSTTLNFNTITASEIENWYESGYINTFEDELIVAFNDTDINFEAETFDSISFDDDSENDSMESYLENLEENTILNEIQ